MNDNDNGKWVGVAALNAAVSAWLIYSIVIVAEPSQTVMILKIALLTGCLFGLGRALLKMMLR